MTREMVLLEAAEGEVGDMAGVEIMAGLAMVMSMAGEAMARQIIMLAGVDTVQEECHTEGKLEGDLGEALGAEEQQVVKERNHTKSDIFLQSMVFKVIINTDN